MHRCAGMPRGTRRYSNADRQLENNKPFETPPMPWPPSGKFGDLSNVRKQRPPLNGDIAPTTRSGPLLPLPHVQFRETENSWRLDSSHRGGHPRDIPRLVDASDVCTVNALKTLPAWSMHYEKAPCFKRSKPDDAPPPLRCAVQGFAPLRRCSRVTAVVCPMGKGLQESLVKLAGEWHFTLRERQALVRMIFPPRRQLK